MTPLYAKAESISSYFPPLLMCIYLYLIFFFKDHSQLLQLFLLLAMSITDEAKRRMQASKGYRGRKKKGEEMMSLESHDHLTCQ